MAFLEDPRLRQRWNQIAQDAEAATENAAAGIWSFQHNYINPCLGCFLESIERCTTVCLGDAEERMRRRRERDRAAEYSFDFYDDWNEEGRDGGGGNSGGGGLRSGWGSDDWDRLLAGTGSSRRKVGDATEQPRRTRGMSYGARGARRKANNRDPTIIPSTRPIGFLSRLPWKLGGTLRYKPSAADLQEHPAKRGNGETEPLLGSDQVGNYGEQLRMPRRRSGTTGSGDTSDSFRSRGDLLPSDGEGDEDAVVLDDEVTYDMVRKDDRSSGRSGRTRSSKGKRPADVLSVSRTESRTTLGSTVSAESRQQERRSRSPAGTTDMENSVTLEDVPRVEDRPRREEDEELARKRELARQLAAARDLRFDGEVQGRPERKPEVAEDEEYEADGPETGARRRQGDNAGGPERPTATLESAEGTLGTESTETAETDFRAARLPSFG
ncbi:hypothetical protein DCS_05116 [Drechmeria coniospora]|uniref:Uncharacterized protein n=1 Tax=Drechmeria coniospora TaxID=98403 RepID=A0A151GLX3_DRECN|nr:hypothetical protein DCS_05116 [Drechmeria coniospora]KYK58103.1 hypothetical protein DCS_05116 [Drechmeria coniospora]